MQALNRKLLRDLWQIKTQALAISLVIAAGVALFVMSLSTYESLALTRDTYYQRYRFAEVFANLKRGPQRLEQRIAAIPGVDEVATRVVADVTVDVEGLSEPVVGRLISRPEDHARRQPLNDVALLLGRDLEPSRPDEVLVNQGFALAHDLQPGDRVTAVINGRRRHLEIVGIALSPEYVYTLRPGDILPDEGRFGLFWMSHRALAAAFDMEGGFNDVALTVAPGTVVDDVLAGLDRLLAPYGGLGAVAREHQASHWWLDDQLAQLRDMAFVIPVIFLGVAAFLLSVVLSRIIAVQRGQIAALKALGYSAYEIGRHYVLWGIVISLLGGAIGSTSGAWLAVKMVELQNDFFRFPFLAMRFSPALIVGAFAISIVPAALGTIGAVRRAVSLPPAEAMRPEPPAKYRVSWAEKLGLQSFLPQAARMVLRNLGRQPGRALASIIGIAFAGAILIVGLFSLDGFDEVLHVQFDVVQRQDVTVSFVEPLSARGRYEIARLPGVLHSEGMRAVPVRLRHGHLSRRLQITGLTGDARLNRVIDASLARVELPPEGLVLSKKLAELLAVERGDEVILEVLEGARPIRRATVAALVDEYMGMSAYMEIDALHQLMRESEVLSGAYLQVDEAQLETLYRRLKTTPSVAAVTLKSAAIDSFNRMIKDFMGVTIFFNVLFAAIIAFGVVYNTARVSLSERAHELASLRVLGFTRQEISAILLGELALLTVLALPLGMLLGYGLAAVTVQAYETEIYRIPLLISGKIYTLSAVTVLVATAVSGFVVRRRLDHLDLVEVLKTRE